MNNEKSYQQMMAELQDLLHRLGRAEDTDVDAMVHQVEQARELLEACETRLEKATVAVHRVLQCDRSRKASSLPPLE
jgi:exodeoxyribonuclease VII small subunit